MPVNQGLESLKCCHVHLASEWYVWVSQTGMSELRFANESIILRRRSLETLYYSVSQGRKVKISKNARSLVAFSYPRKLWAQNIRSHYSNLELIRSKFLLFSKLETAVQEPNAETCSSYTIPLKLSHRKWLEWTNPVEVYSKRISRYKSQKFIFTYAHSTPPAFFFSIPWDSVPWFQITNTFYITGFQSIKKKKKAREKEPGEVKTNYLLNTFSRRKGDCHRGKSTGVNMWKEIWLTADCLQG